MNPLRGRGRIMFSVTVSIALHLFLLGPLFVEGLSAGAAPIAPARLEMPENAIRLGIDAPNPSSFTWIGYEEYEQHVAEQSEVEQSAFTNAPRSESELPPSVASEAAPSGETSEPSEAEVEVEVAAESTTEAEKAAEAVPESATAAKPVPELSIGDVADALAVFEQLLASLPAPPPAQPTREETKQATAAAPPKPAATPSEPRPDGGGDSDVDPLDGEVSDKDAPATSVATLDEIRHGKVIAGQGMEVTPRRLQLTPTIVVTSAPCPPTVEIDFGPGGIVIDARIVKTSCDPRIDHALVSNLFNWKAKGKRIDALTKGQTASIKIKMLLRR